MSEAASDPIRLVVSDIDGTLVRRDKSLPAENVAAMRDLVARGVAVSLISARPPAGIAPIAAALGLTGPLAAFNGATLYRAGGTILSAAHLPDALARALIDRFTGAGVTLWVFAQGQWLTSDAANPHTARERLSSGIEPVAGADLSACTAADKLVAVSDDPALLAKVQAEARALVGSAATVVRSQTYYLDVTAPAGNKGSGIAALAAAYDVPLAQTAALGDQANDVAMFRRAGLAIAMGQAPPEVRTEADCIAASNENAGVADAIARFVIPRLR